MQNVYAGMSPRMSAFIAVSMLIISGSFIFYNVVNRIDHIVNRNFTEIPASGDTEYIAENKIFDTYTPMINVRVIMGV